MATSTVASATFINQLKTERDTCFQDAEKLEHRGRILDELIGEYQVGKQQGQKSAQAKPHNLAAVPKKPVQSAGKKQMAKTSTPAKKVTSMQKTKSQPKPAAKPNQAEASGQSTMEIVRQVLNNAGQELRVEEVRRACKDDFGHTPAASLDQMLYKRSKSGSDFYAIKDKDGRNRYGLLAWRQGQRAA